MDRGWQFRLLIMSNYKLYSVISSGYRLNVRAALISNRYPLNTREITNISSLSVTSGELTLVPTYKDSFNMSALSVVSGDLRLFEFPIIREEAVISPLGISSGTLNAVITQPADQKQDIIISNLSIASGNLQLVVVEVLNQTEQSINLSNLSLVSGTLI